MIPEEHRIQSWRPMKKPMWEGVPNGGGKLGRHSGMWQSPETCVTVTPRGRAQGVKQAKVKLPPRYLRQSCTAVHIT